MKPFRPASARFAPMLPRAGHTTSNPAFGNNPAIFSQFETASTDTVRVVVRDFGAAQSFLVMLSAGGGSEAGVPVECATVGIPLLQAPARARIGTCPRGPFLSVEFSPSSILNGGINLLPVTRIGFVRAVERLADGLAEAGLRCDPWSGTIGRLDVFRQRSFEPPLEPLLAVLGALTPPRMSTRRFKGTGFLWGNGQHQINAYLKDEQLRRKNGGRLPAAYRELPPTLRFEYRCLKPRKVREVYGLRTLGDLRWQWDCLDAGYGEAMAKLLFTKENIRAIRDADSLKAAIQFAKSHSSARWIDEALKHEGARSLAGRHGQEAVLAAFKAAGASDPTLHRLGKRLQEPRSVPVGDAGEFRRIYRLLQDFLAGEGGGP